MEDFLWGLWNGVSAWPVLIAHVFGIWERFPVYNIGRDEGWYQFGYLLGAGSPIMGFFGRRSAASEPSRWRPLRGRTAIREA